MQPHHGTSERSPSGPARSTHDHRAPGRSRSRPRRNRPAALVPTRSTDPRKRGVDVLLSLVGLLLTAPAWLVLPLWIRLEDAGPVFHTQERVGKGGELFTSWKFRSMRPRREREQPGPPEQAEREQDRVTRVGAFMRRCALDELPQLLNILRGDMSLVGPRPLLPEEVEHRGGGEEPVRLEELPGYAERHSIRPGLTGFAQTATARDLPHREKFVHDLRYVRNRGLLLDLDLIARSVWISLCGRWPSVGRTGETEEGRPARAEVLPGGADEARDAA